MKRFNSAAIRGELSGGFIAEETRRSIERRAVEVAIWGMPLVGFAAMRQAYLSETGGRYGDILYFIKPADWRFQLATPSASSLYAYFNFNLRQGAVVLELPAAVESGFSGTIEDAWQTPLLDVGSDGERYLLLPPDQSGDIPEGYVGVRSPTYNGYALFRMDNVAFVKDIRVYPLAPADSSSPSRHIDITGRLFDGIVRYDHAFYECLARMVDEEPTQERDLVPLAALRTLGIGKAEEFKPDPAIRDILIRSIREAHLTFMRHSSEGEPWWPDSQWIRPAIADLGAATGYSYRTADGLAIDERAANFFLTCAPPKKSDDAAFYLAAYRDAKGLPLQGGRTYRLRVPPNVPATQSWSVTAYDLETSGFIREAATLAIDSCGDIQRNGDRSVDIYLGPIAPVGKESNWICTARGRPWFAAFRLDGPEKAVFDQTWRLAEIEEATHHARLIWRV
jgi:hypothetical protein